MITEASTPSELQQRNIDAKQYSEEQIKIYSEMLVNENKEDVKKCYEPLELIGQGSFGKVFKVREDKGLSRRDNKGRRCKWRWADQL